MSRVGKKSITLPDKVTVKVNGTVLTEGKDYIRFCYN